MKYVSLDEVRKRVNKADLDSSNEISQILVCGLLVRYGILGEDYTDIINLKIKHIDNEKNFICIYDEFEINIVRMVKIDQYLLEWLYRANNADNNNNNKLIDSEYILKPLDKFKDKNKSNKITKATLQSRFDKFLIMCNLYEYTPNSFYILRQIDYAMYLEKKNGCCEAKDYINISYKFHNYINNYEILMLKKVHERVKSNQVFYIDKFKRKDTTKVTERSIKILIDELNKTRE